ncbi:Ribonuclease H1 [Mycena venus]|uniref:ribonuclease H n=1 Tax=Mycena venus TaxID=2733690 RepID=A0A8H6YKH6_9AGAR|nr:Ribonuclease H1 [Mycena venus]
MMTDALESARTAAEQNRFYYGPATVRTDPIYVYAASSCVAEGKPNVRAGSGVYWGPNNRSNRWSSVPGKQTDGRAALFAVTLAVLAAPRDRSLILYTSSKFVIRTFCYWTGKNYTEGWPCQNADIIKVTAELIRERSAGVEFRYAASPQTNNHSREALALARKAARNPNIPPSTLPVIGERSNVVDGAPVDEGDAKVFTSLPEEEPSKVTPVRVTDDDLEPDPPAHRGRARERAMPRENLETLLNVASNKEFWSLVRGWTDPKHRTAQVSAEQLREVFEARLNPPEIVPEEFDRDERERHRWLSDMLPDSTPDTSPHKTFSRPFTIADIEDVKLHIRKHNIKSASGTDRVSYRKILQIPNDILVQLFQASMY